MLLQVRKALEVSWKTAMTCPAATLLAIAPGPRCKLAGPAVVLTYDRSVYRPRHALVVEPTLIASEDRPGGSPHCKIVRYLSLAACDYHLDTQ